MQRGWSAYAPSGLRRDSLRDSPFADDVAGAQRRPSRSRLTCQAGEGWRRERDSNPWYGFPYTRFPSVLLKPLGHLSVRME